MSAAEWIADQKARLPFAEWRDTADLLTDHHRALDALEAVLEPHQLHRVPGGQEWCLHCGGDWPCPTVTAIESALRAEP